MIFGILFVCVVFAVFTATHFLKNTPDHSVLQLAGELSVIVLTGMFLVAAVIALRHWL